MNSCNKTYLKANSSLNSENKKKLAFFHLLFAKLANYTSLSTSQEKSYQKKKQRVRQMFCFRFNSPVGAKYPRTGSFTRVTHTHNPRLDAFRILGPAPKRDVSGGGGFWVVWGTQNEARPIKKDSVPFFPECHVASNSVSIA